MVGGSLLKLAEELAIADEVPEDHVIFGEGAGFVGEDILNLSQILINGSVVGLGKAVIAAGVPVLVPG